MNTASRVRRFPRLVALALVAVLGCEAASERGEPRPAPAPPPEPKKVLVGPNVFLEVQGTRRTVLVSAEVCMRAGALELLLCRKNTKEHEAILAADVDARTVHEALLLAGGTEGSPVTYQPVYKPATGQVIDVTLRYEDKGKLVTVPARSWIKHGRTGKELASPWVFAGSRLVQHPLDKDKKVYLANDGDLICVSNFESALLDLPVRSSKDNADLEFVADTARIPPVGTKVVVALEPRAGTGKGR